MSSAMNFEGTGLSTTKGKRSHSAQGLGSFISSPTMKIPLPPRLWITDVEDESSDGTDCSAKEDGVISVERARVRSRFRHYKQRSSMPIGIFWDIENCQVPRGCSAIDVVAAIRAKFLTSRREADFVVVCDVRKESSYRLQELNDAQISLIHVCGTQKNAADEKLRQCMRRFGELHMPPASLLLISSDINFAADLSDFRHRKNMEVILVHKQHTSSALIACATSHYCFNDMTAHLPRNKKIDSRTASQTEESEQQVSCEMEVGNLPADQPAERVSRRLRRLADNCGGKVLRVNSHTATLRFPTPDHASRALKRMDGEDVFGRKISTRYARSLQPPTYSSDEGYSTAPPAPAAAPAPLPPPPQLSSSPCEAVVGGVGGVASEWALALQQLPAPTPPPLEFCPPPAPRPRKIRGTHGSVSLDRSGSSSNNGDVTGAGAGAGAGNMVPSRSHSPWNCSGSVSNSSDDDGAELTVGNLPPYEPVVLQEMLTQLFGQYVPVVRVSVWAGGEGPVAQVALRSEWDARMCIARVHKRRLDAHWAGRRLELALGQPSPAPTPDVLRARLRAILLDQKGHALPLLRLRDAYASRHCCALTTSDLAKVKDTVAIHEGFGRMVQLLDLTPVSGAEAEEAPWKCHLHAGANTTHEDSTSRILQPVFMELSVLTKQVHLLLESHMGIVPLLSFAECYEATFGPLPVDPRHGVALELLLRAVPGVEVRDGPSRHIAWRNNDRASAATPPSSHISGCSRASSERSSPRTAPALEPMLALFERELVDLLRSAPRCTIPFSKLIPAFHHHFGRQCRVADYGFTKLPELLGVLADTVAVLGSGSARVITLSAAAQARRWANDLVRMLKNHPSRAASPHEIPQLYQATFGKPFSPVEYGVCTLEELVARAVGGGAGGGAGGAVCAGEGGVLALPRRTPTPDERARTGQFAMQAVELLCHTGSLRMEFSRFVPAYHAHFGRQLRVAHYGCVKLLELFELIPEWVTVTAPAPAAEPTAERCVRLAPQPARQIIGQRLQALCPVSLAALPGQYALQFGALPQPDIVEVSSVEALVYACGGCVQGGVVVAPGLAPAWGSAQLAAAAVLAADRSVGGGSTQEYFESAYRRACGSEPDVGNLAASGVIHLQLYSRRVLLTPAWRAIFRLACIVADQPRTLPNILHEYSRRYQINLVAEMGGEEAVLCVLRSQGNVFACEAGGRWALLAGVTPPRAPPPPQPAREDYSLHDTPPGQKGSRVFDSPRALWCSPPASALPPPTALLPPDHRRRTRLAAHFDAA